MLINWIELGGQRASGIKSFKYSTWCSQPGWLHHVEYASGASRSNQISVVDELKRRIISELAALRHAVIDSAVKE